LVSRLCLLAAAVEKVAASWTRFLPQFCTSTTALTTLPRSAPLCGSRTDSWVAACFSCCAFAEAAAVGVLPPVVPAPELELELPCMAAMTTPATTSTSTTAMIAGVSGPLGSRDHGRRFPSCGGPGGYGPPGPPGG
jgi:hypothetical protein